MTTQNFHQTAAPYSSRFPQHKNRKIAFGFLILLIGTALLGKRLGFFFPHFHIWPFILIGIGIYLGIKHRFQHFGSWALIALGTIFLIPGFFVMGVYSAHLIGPLFIILAGIYIIVKPHRKNHWRGRHCYEGVMDDDTIDLDLSFGERNVVITSKNFHGGFISTSFGSTKINMLQADATQPIVLDMKVSFGSVEIVIPAHWEIETSVNNSFGSVEDKRNMFNPTAPEKKLLVLKGSCSFGSITIKSL